ncbi:hypothetical protein MRB53_007102 [Persea americana]|uniref:Uncharacterized protein n=1 Tax=Persea americana TaxID=3435 RepID=A0ACC2MI19_PERAE|nr:hypothetical protein MRB53_007102 [Persea americana]
MTTNPLTPLQSIIALVKAIFLVLLAISLHSSLQIPRFEGLVDTQKPPELILGNMTAAMCVYPGLFMGLDGWFNHLIFCFLLAMPLMKQCNSISSHVGGRLKGICRRKRKLKNSNILQLHPSCLCIDLALGSIFLTCYRVLLLIQD